MDAKKMEDIVAFAITSEEQLIINIILSDFEIVYHAELIAIYAVIKYAFKENKNYVIVSDSLVCLKYTKFC